MARHQLAAFTLGVANLAATAFLHPDDLAGLMAGSHGSLPSPLGRLSAILISRYLDIC